VSFFSPTLCPFGSFCVLRGLQRAEVWGKEHSTARFGDRCGRKDTVCFLARVAIRVLAKSRLARCTCSDWCIVFFFAPLIMSMLAELLLCTMCVVAIVAGTGLYLDDAFFQPLWYTWLRPSCGRMEISAQLLCSADLMVHTASVFVFGWCDDSCPDFVPSWLFGRVCTAGDVARNKITMLTCRADRVDHYILNDNEYGVRLQYEVDLARGDTCLLLAPDTLDTARFAVLNNDTFEYYSRHYNGMMRKKMFTPSSDDDMVPGDHEYLTASQPVSVFTAAAGALHPCIEGEQHKLYTLRYLIPPPTCPIPDRATVLPLRGRHTRSAVVRRHNSAVVVSFARRPIGDGGHVPGCIGHSRAVAGYLTLHCTALIVRPYDWQSHVKKCCATTNRVWRGVLSTTTFAKSCCAVSFAPHLRPLKSPQNTKRTKRT
jgi:hypothetical protein